MNTSPILEFLMLCVLDLVFEDIGKAKWVKNVVEKAKNITKFIYYHSWVVHLMRKNFKKRRDLVRPNTVSIIS